MEAACGPSNGMKSLQRHFDVDSSLHQSRIHAHTPNASFRQVNPQEVERARLEQESFGFERRDAGPVHRDAMHGPWASEFRNSLPSPQTQHMPQSITQSQTRQEQRGLGSWGHEFMASRNATPTTTIVSRPAAAAAATTMMMGGQGYMPYSGQLYAPHSQQGTRHAHDEVMGDQVNGMDAAAFAEAFAEAEASLSATRERDLVQGSHEFMVHNQEAEMAIRGGDMETETREEVERRFEGDALADVAGDLIHALRDEESPKFKGSQFMALMHQLRDREVVVEENKMVHAATREEIGTHRTRDIDAPISRENALRDVTF